MAKIVRQFIEENKIKNMFDLSKRENVDELVQAICTAAFVAMAIAYLRYI